MEEASIVNAVERLEAALRRLEAAVRQQGDLGQRHASLKASISRSVEELDRLIAESAP
jgi:hypothetical protein